MALIFFLLVCRGLQVVSSMITTRVLHGLTELESALLWERMKLQWVRCRSTSTWGFILIPEEVAMAETVNNDAWCRDCQWLSKIEGSTGLGGEVMWLWTLGLHEKEEI